MPYIQNNNTLFFILFLILGIIIIYYYTIKIECFTNVYTDLELNKLSKTDFLKDTGTEPSYFGIVHNLLKPKSTFEDNINFNMYSDIVYLGNKL